MGNRCRSSELAMENCSPRDSGGTDFILSIGAPATVKFPHTAPFLTGLRKMEISGVCNPASSEVKRSYLLANRSSGLNPWRFSDSESHSHMMVGHPTPGLCWLALFSVLPSSHWLVIFYLSFFFLLLLPLCLYIVIYCSSLKATPHH